MPIVQPGKRPGPRLAHSKVFGKKFAQGKKSGYASLNLTPMVDMFTIIVIYLIQSFNADGEILTMSKDIQLPAITPNSWKLERAPVISISAEAVLLDGTRIVDTRDLTRDEQWDSPSMVEALRDKRRLIEQSNLLLRGGDEPFRGIINVQADKQLEFKVLKKVMYACNQAGFASINFAGLTYTPQSGEGVETAMLVPGGH